MTGLFLCLLQYEGRTPQVQVLGYATFPYTT